MTADALKAQAVAVSRAARELRSYAEGLPALIERRKRPQHDLDTVRRWLPDLIAAAKSFAAILEGKPPITVPPLKYQATAVARAAANERGRRDQTAYLVTKGARTAEYLAEVTTAAADLEAAAGTISRLVEQPVQAERPSAPQRASARGRASGKRNREIQPALALSVG